MKSTENASFSITFTSTSKIIQLPQIDPETLSKFMKVLHFNWAYDPETSCLVSKDPYWNPNMLTISNSQSDFPGGLKTANFIEINGDSMIINIDKIIENGTLDDCYGMFMGFDSVTKIKNLNELNTSYVHRMSYMFNGCKCLKSLDLSNLDTSHVEGMQNMFEECCSLTHLDLSNFTSTFCDMRYMFHLCDKLVSIDFGPKELSSSGQNLCNVFDVSHIFDGCRSLVQLDLSSFNLSQLHEFSCMFCGCEKLKFIKFNRINVPNVWETDSMFQGCSSLESIDLSIFNLTDDGNMSNMFSGCDSLKSIDFSNCGTLNPEHPRTNDRPVVTKVTNLAFMFKDCVSLESIDLSLFDTSKAKWMNKMFCGCEKLTRIRLGHRFTIKKNTTTGGMFEGCENLREIYLDNKNSIKRLKEILGDEWKYNKNKGALVRE